MVVGGGALAQAARLSGGQVGQLAQRCGRFGLAGRGQPLQAVRSHQGMLHLSTLPRHGWERGTGTARSAVGAARERQGDYVPGAVGDTGRRRRAHDATHRQRFLAKGGEAPRGTRRSF